MANLRKTFVLFGISKEPNWLGSKHVPLPLEGHNELLLLIYRHGLNALTA